MGPNTHTVGFLSLCPPKGAEVMMVGETENIINLTGDKPTPVEVSESTRAVAYSGKAAPLKKGGASMLECVLSEELWSRCVYVDRCKEMSRWIG